MFALNRFWGVAEGPKTNSRGCQTSANSTDQKPRSYWYANEINDANAEHDDWNGKKKKTGTMNSDKKKKKSEGPFSCE